MIVTLRIAGLKYIRKGAINRRAVLRRRGAKVVIGTSADYQAAKRFLAARWREQTRARFTGPVAVSITLNWDRMAHRYGLAAVDVDAHAKIILDSLEAARVLEDDAQVVELRLRKFVAKDSPGIEVEVEDRG